MYIYIYIYVLLVSFIDTISKYVVGLLSLVSLDRLLFNLLQITITIPITITSTIITYGSSCVITITTMTMYSKQN